MAVTAKVRAKRQSKTKSHEKPSGSRAQASVADVTDEQALVRLFRVLTEKQFDFWLESLNRAVAAMGGKEGTFNRDDRQKTISYWYLLMYLLEIYAARRNPFERGNEATGFSEALISMGALTRAFKGHYKDETIRRYVFDLKQARLIAIDGRGAASMLQLSLPAVRALADTIREWVTTFRDVDQRIQKMPVF
ncbi:MAG: hypothetical protein AB7S70_04045 [Hyphomicrobium sp.]|uniref:hypothetical protein n=1 Tax=Hyphomicrobium sp. TaxID=82 RepID=UPI003D0AB4A9